MRKLSELKADPKWVALHKKTLAKRDATLRRARHTARQRPAPAKAASNELGQGSAAMSFPKAVADIVEREGLSIARATVEANKRFPGARERYVAKYNQERRRQRKY